MYIETGARNCVLQSREVLMVEITLTSLVMLYVSHAHCMYNPALNRPCRRLHLANMHYDSDIKD